MSSSIWNGTVPHSPRRLNTSPLRSLRSSGHASSPDTRSFKSFVHSPRTLLHYCEIPDHPAVRSGLLASGWSYAGDIDTHDFTLGDWFWTVKHNPSTWFHCPCREQFTKPMWWSILYSSAELLPDCPCLDQFSDEDWRRLNILPKLKSRIRNSEQFRKLIDLTRYPFHTHRSEDNLSL